MADTKTSDLTALTGANVDTAADILMIVDTDVTTAKKILIDELRIAIGIATQAQQETGTSNVVFVTPGRQHFHPSAVKGWVKANINGTVDGSYNVTSVTDNGTGDITVNWATDFGDTNYVVVNALKVDLGGSTSTTYVTTINDTSGFAAGTTKSQMVRVSDGTVAVDPTEWMFVALGDFA